MFLILLLAFLYGALANNITSNIPTVVTSSKNYTTSRPTWVTSPFFRAGQQAVITTYTGSSQYPFASYTFTYSSALPGVPNLAYGIQSYYGNDYFGQQFYEIRQTGRTATTFSVQIQIFGVTNLWILSVAYIAVDPTFPHHLNSFDNVPINYTAGDIVNITSQQNYLTYYTNYINYTSQANGMTFTKFTQPYSRNYVVIFMTSLWIRSSGTPLQLHVYPEIVNSSHYLWNITLYKSTLITNLHFSQIIFNSDDVQSSKKYFIIFQKWYNDMNGGFIQIPIEFVDNFIMAVTSFQAVSGNCGFVYDWNFITKSISGVDTFGIQLKKSWHVNNRCGFSWSQSSIFYMMTWRCDAPYYFFNLTSNLCQTLCGGFNIQNQANFTCDPCANSKCYQCDPYNTDVCTECATYLNYELSSGKCVCQPRYFPTNESCLHCSYDSVGCINCTYDDGNNGALPYDNTLFSCIDCNNTENYFLVGKSCTLCTLSHCLYCQNLTACAVCDSGYDYSDTQTCIQCLVTGCKNCSSTNVNICTTCNNSQGYYNNATTNKCSTLCGDGIYVPATEDCDDNNTIDHDGCSSICSVEASFSCSGSPSVCYFSSAVVLSVDSQAMESSICNTITFGFRFTPPSDTFAQPYVNWDMFLTSPNDSILQPNVSMTTYSSGVLSVSYFLLDHLQNQTLIFEADFTTLIDNSSILNLTRADPLTFTVVTTPEALMICCDGYFMAYSPIRCEEICGDGILYQLPCDDGNLIDHDGCSSTCTIQTNYVCINGTTTTPSICSYNGTIDVTLDTGDKDPRSNSLTLSYSVIPIEPFAALNNGSTNFSSMVTFPASPGVTVIQATINPSTNQLVVIIEYTQKLQDTELSIQITPPSVPQAFLMTKITETWVVKPSNQLSAVVYSQSDYQTVEKLTPFVDTLLGLYIGVAVLSIVSRKFIGLELACLVQMGYLSLLHNKQITTYQQPMANWNSVFGYSNFHMSNLPNQRFRSPYALYGFQAHFGFSNNMMIIIAASTFGVSILLLLASMVASSSTARKLKNAAFLVANQLSYSIVVFITSSMVTALAIEAQEGTIADTSILWSKGFLVGGILIILVSHLLNLSTAEQNPDVGTYFRKHTKIGIYMPIVFNIRLVTLTVLLFVYHISPTVPSYLLIIIQIGYLLLIVFGRPHKKPLDIGRAICLQVGLLYIFVMRFTEVEVLAEEVQSGSIIYPLIAYIEYGFYSLSIIVSTVSMIYHFYKRFKGKKVGEQKVQDNKQDSLSPQRNLINNSSAQLNAESPTRKGEINPLIFDLDEMEVDLPQTSVMSLDSKRASRKRKTGWKK